MSTPSRFTLKQQATDLQDEARALGKTLTRGQALEEVARRAGFRDWNTASAAASIESFITLSRPPTDDDMTFGVEMETFWDAFNASRVEGFTARVERVDGGRVLLDGYFLPEKSGWYTVFEK